ncbi:PREDICTED: coagulation factor X-like [Corvus brachyrhynchos]|uniref:coagulation factor X-like n=1 Tax=Corvus brachyrhynchos TaxID=85066 RepID=UPI0008164A61|nr:PREDICTED: coagulation factor X-like [Corvus brachyrhynchos]
MKDGLRKLTALPCSLKMLAHLQQFGFWFVFVDGNQCSSNPCHYGGHCKDGIGSYTCSCLDGYQGKNCEFVIPKFCRINNGDCEQFCTVKRDGPKDVLCSCADGYVLAEDGKHCVSKGKKPRDKPIAMVVRLLSVLRDVSIHS